MTLVDLSGVGCHARDAGRGCRWELWEEGERGGLYIRHLFASRIKSSPGRPKRQAVEARDAIGKKCR
jgi:hypothetical protein